MMKNKSTTGSPWKLLLLASFLGVSLTFILTFQLLPSRYQVRVGEVNRDNIKSPRQVTFVSQILTKEERDRAEAQVEAVYRHDPLLANEQMSRAKEATRQIWSVLSSVGRGPEEKRLLLKSVPGVSLSPEATSTLVGLPSSSWPAMEGETLRVVEAAMRERIPALELARVKGDLEGRVSPTLSPDQARVVAELASGFIKSNVLLDREATDQARRAAREAIEPVRVSLEKGETIVRDGEIVTPPQIEKLAAAGLLTPVVRWEDLAGTGLPVVMLALVLVFYIRLYEPHLANNLGKLYVLALIIVVTALAAKLIIPGRDVYAFLFPTAAAPMLVATLINVPTAILSTVLLSVVVGFIGTGSVELMAVHLVASLVGTLLIRRGERLTSFFLAGGGVAAASFLVILAFRLLSQDYEAPRLALYAFVSVVNGGLASILTLGILALLGLAFGLATPLQLLELAHPNQHLLRLLAMEAPGTYHHSILVSNLAERAAEAIGADSLLVRVGAYYHDVGKVARPGFFVENQMDGENIHDDLEPTTSARVVAAHVEEGIKLAQKHRLPHQIHDLIAQHHGTKLVTYFYYRARREGETVDPASYRYPGPPPQSKEAAILMLADTIEATARSMTEHPPQSLDALVEQTVADCLADGQLNQCDLTLRELEAIKESFKSVLKGSYHPRIEYPASSQIAD